VAPALRAALRSMPRRHLPFLIDGMLGDRHNKYRRMIGRWKNVSRFDGCVICAHGLVPSGERAAGAKYRLKILPRATDQWQPGRLLAVRAIIFLKTPPCATFITHSRNAIAPRAQT